MADVVVTPMDQVTICNMAISLTGQGKFIGAIDENSSAAQACNLHYIPSLMELLGEYQWNCFTKIAALDLIRETVPDPAGLEVEIPWRFQYAYPTDCAYFAGIVSGYAKDTLFTYIDSRIVNQDEGEVVFCNMPNALAEYVLVALDPAKYPAHFRKAFYYLLASKISPQLTQKEAKTAQLLQLYGIFKDKAIARDLREGKRIRPRNSAAQDSRGGYGTRSGSTQWNPPAPGFNVVG